MQALRKRRPLQTKANLAAIVPTNPSRWARHHPGLKLIVQEAKARAEEAGYGMDIIALDEQREEQPGVFARMLRARGITGLMLVHLTDIAAHVAVPWGEFAACGVGQSIDPALGLDEISSDHLQVARLAVDKLLSSRHRKLGFVVNRSLSQQVRKIYELVWDASRLAHPSRLLPPFEAADKDTVLSWTAQHRPDALFTTEARLYGWLTSAGYRVPDDIALALSDRPAGAGPWAGVDQNHRLIGQAAVDFLVARVVGNRRGPSPAPIGVQIPGRWLAGASFPPR